MHRRTLLQGLAAGAGLSVADAEQAGATSSPETDVSVSSLDPPRAWLFDPEGVGLGGGRLSVTYTRRPGSIGPLAGTTVDTAAWLTVAGVTLSLVGGDLDPATVTAAVVGDRDHEDAVDEFTVATGADGSTAVAVSEAVAVAGAGRTAAPTTAAVTATARGAAERGDSLWERRPAGVTLHGASSVADPAWVSGWVAPAGADDRLSAVTAAVAADEPATVEKRFVFRDRRTRRAFDPVRVAEREGRDLLAPVSSLAGDVTVVERDGRVVTVEAPIERVPASGYV